VRLPAIMIGVLIMAQGVLGLASPTMLAGVVGTIQIAPVMYSAAVVRVLIGVILVLAASGSRAPKSLRCLGALIFLAGLLTPFIGLQFAQFVLAWWSDGGPAVVYVWAGALLLLGAFIVYANIPSRRAA
jgi:hypothetical protein